MEDLRARLEAIAEELADLALDRLHRASEDGSTEGVERARLVADERRLTRARRAVEKAVALLDEGSARAGLDPNS
ncbi:MAG: hypothetical protein M3144_00335 [Actinomycetota bacterium]|nr:hypothetical protein [Actinomycetota bacterium]